MLLCRYLHLQELLNIPWVLLKPTTSILVHMNPIWVDKTCGSASQRRTRWTIWCRNYAILVGQSQCDHKSTEYFKSSGMWCYINGQVFPGTLKYCGAFIFRASGPRTAMLKTKMCYVCVQSARTWWNSWNGCNIKLQWDKRVLQCKCISWPLRGTVILQNIRKYWPNDTESQDSRLTSSPTLLW